MTYQLARTAHDVRHLCVCTPCGQLADDRYTVRCMHPKCFYEKHGGAAVLSLSIDEQNKFALGDIPMGLMKRLLK